MFNRSDATQTLHYDFGKLGIPEGGYEVRDLWEQRDLGAAKAIDLKLAAHASALYFLASKLKQ